MLGVRVPPPHKDGRLSAAEVSSLLRRGEQQLVCGLTRGAGVRSHEGHITAQQHSFVVVCGCSEAELSIANSYRMTTSQLPWKADTQVQDHEMK